MSDQPSPLTQLIANWREIAKLIEARHWDRVVDEAQAFDRCANELESALAGIGEASASASGSLEKKGE